MGRFILSAFADEYSPDLDTQLSMLREHGIPFLEPRGVNGKNIAELDKNEVAGLSKKLRDAGIGVSSIGSPLGKISLDDDFAAHLEKCARVFETACTLGTKNVRMFSFYPHKDRSIHDDRAEVLDKLGQMLEIADSFGVTLCHENEAKIYGESPEDCLDLLTHFGGRLGCVFDMGNFVLDGHDPAPAYEKLKEHIVYFHIKDSLSAGAIVPPGLGEAKIAEVLGAFMRDFDRDVMLTLEPHLQTFSGLNALTDVSFDNPYKFETPEAAFVTAIQNLKEILA